MSARVVGRASDERFLRWIADRCRGLSSIAIAARDGVAVSQILAATNAVKHADARESGEDVRRAYWR